MLTTEASNKVFGAILSQGPIGRDLPIAYVSRMLINAEKNYSNTEELLATVWGCKQFRQEIYHCNQPQTSHLGLQCKGPQFEIT